MMIRNCFLRIFNSFFIFSSYFIFTFSVRIFSSFCIQTINTSKAMMGIKQDHENSTGACCLEQKYKPGTLVWAKVFGYPYWPAMIEDDPDEGTYSKDLTTAPKFHVGFFDTPASRAWLASIDIRPFHLSPPIQKNRKSVSSKKYRNAVLEAEKAEKMTNEERRLEKHSFAVQRKIEMKIKRSE
ncbi:zinc finger CW-type PWWP domain protein 1-like [Argiope bruennichi]|uniref:zinc finger CW-type PWWP domain protein 1-like n=1 Tax=Argiope bruennichi TaxID=94029 RepID=UPI00249409A7|nr:zinc finger CW-type PWWP domain protein 1-like [Argiope bruennichi]XP_055926932.1 zinc finger CW-type PWWP domain protein 1-like [Argiope bruennichi]